LLFMSIPFLRESNPFERQGHACYRFPIEGST
jgi:hypothetical protein